MLIRALLLATWPLVSWGAAYDFDYRSVGDPDARPANVFDDGAATFFQFTPGRPVPAIFKLGPGGEQLADWRPDGPYIVVEGVLTDWRLRLGRGVAAVRYAGSRPLAVKGALYGAAAPISEPGPAALPSAPTPRVAAIAPQQAPSVASAAPTPPVPGATPIKSVLPAVLPEFAGSFVVQKLGGLTGSSLTSSTTAAQPTTRTASAASMAAPAGASSPAQPATVLKMAWSLHPARIPAKPIVVRFKGNGLLGQEADLASLARDARQHSDDWTIHVLAYSGARSPLARKQWAERRGERVRAVLAEAGVDPGRVHVIASTVASKPLVLVSFVSGGVRI